MSKRFVYDMCLPKLARFLPIFVATFSSLDCYNAGKDKRVLLSQPK